MYHCFNAKKFLKIIVIDITIIALAAGFIKFSGIDWSALDYEAEKEGIFLPVIMYHSIVDDSSKINQYTVTPEIIENDMKYLKNQGFETVLTEELIQYIENDAPLPEKPVMITLDDGFYNNFCYLVPLLEKYDMKAVVSVVGEFVDSASQHDAHVPEYSYLTWDDISEMSEHSCIEIGNHTYAMHSTEPRKGSSRLSYETPERYSEIFFQDINKLQNLLETNSGVIPVSFAYPFGYISRESIPILKKSGIKATFTCYEKPNYIVKDSDCLFGINRYNRSGNISIEEFMNKALKK